ncbi:restriction endonuclease subunit S [Burkholderia cenocepacia]|uniref:restriction endonuclease subunit S n=1 Tax=Burkholderia cenocepacia TaxID=95486 RepID=UPI000AC281D1|nr:hypothetical protein [Burkholderia cenocepacia]
MSKVRVGDFVLTDEAGFACSKNKLVPKGLPHLRPFNIAESGGFDFTQIYQIPSDAAPNGKSELLVGDILFNNTNSADLVGKSAVVSTAMNAGYSNHITRIRIDVNRAEPLWFGYWLRRLHSTGYFKANATQWVSQAAYRTTDLCKLELNLPPIAEQRRIVDLLSRAEGIVRLRREAQAKAQAIIPALFVDMFGDAATNTKGWPKCPLGELICSGPTNGLYKHKSLYGRGTPILRIDAFYSGKVKDLNALKRVELESDIELKRFEVEQGDIVINRVNSPEYLGKSAIIPELPEPIVFESNMMRLSVNRARVLPEFVIAQLQQPAARNHFLANAKHAINQSSINQQDVKSLPMIVPPIAVQAKFVEWSTNANSILMQQEEALLTAEQTFASILARSFEQ